jgi:predicted solute-binding protein
MRAIGTKHAPMPQGYVIIGMGVDLAEVDRIQKAIERHG